MIIDAAREPGRDGVTVAVLTYRRPDDLARALAALRLETNPDPDAPPRATLLVVDNDVIPSAREIVEAAGPFVRYVHEPTPGIAAARNRALAESTDRYVVFVDDDEEPLAGWLDALLTTAITTGAAAVAGAVVSVFDVEPDRWVRGGEFFRRRRLPTGTAIDTAATNNLLLDRERLGGLRFDTAFGLTGGSDTMFTRTLHRRGELLVWCDEAVVLDRVPADRVTRRWVLTRAFRMSNSGTRVDVALARPGGQRLVVRGRHGTRGLARILGGAARTMIGTVTRRRAVQARGVRTLVRGVGMISAAGGYVHAEYRRPDVHRVPQN